MPRIKIIASLLIFCLINGVCYYRTDVSNTGLRKCNEVQAGWLKYLYWFSSYHESCQSSLGILQIGLQELGLENQALMLQMFAVAKIARCLPTVQFIYRFVRFVVTRVTSDLRDPHQVPYPRSAECS